MCGSVENINEASLAEPIGEFLQKAYGKAPRRGFPHPCFPSSRPGAPRAIDYVVTGDDASPRELRIALETKWITDRNYRKEITNDTLRLQHLCRNIAFPPKAYLLVSGEKATFFKHFRRAKHNDGKRMPFFRYFFNFSSRERKDVDIANAPVRFRGARKIFETEYSCKVEADVVTTLIASINQRGICVYVWQIE